MKKLAKQTRKLNSKKVDKRIANWIVIITQDDFLKRNHEIDFNNLEYKSLLVDLHDPKIDM